MKRSKKRNGGGEDSNIHMAAKNTQVGVYYFKLKGYRWYLEKAHSMGKSIFGNFYIIFITQMVNCRKGYKAFKQAY